MLFIALTAAAVTVTLLTVRYFLAAKQAQLEEARNSILSAQPTIEELHSRLTELLAQDRYVAHHEIVPLTELASSIRTVLAHEPEILNDSSPIKQEFKKCRDFWHDSNSFANRHNQLFVNKECERFESYFDSIEKYPLTMKQRVAAVTNEDNTLVVAGAGTGKTSVMAARAGYLIKRGLVTPDRLLALAYSRKARQELQQRIEKRCKCDVTIKTFHALGLEIIGMAEGAKPSLSPLAEDEVQKTAKLREIVTALAVDSSFTERLLDYFSEFFAPSKCLFEFQSLYEYVSYMRSNEIRTFQGEKVKSFEECKIANYLYAQGVRYQYERKYEYPTTTPYARQYKPDFYLIDYGIYLEHFGVNRQGTPAPYIDAKKYKSGMQWKRSLHRQHKTKLVETYSYQQAEGNLLECLRKALEANGVEFSPVPREQLLERLNELGTLDTFSELLARFLVLYKARDITFSELQELAGASKGSRRATAFVSLFKDVFEEYQEHLKATGDIDFEDMVIRAIQHVQSGKYRSPYSHILVDEFQDIAPDRARLIKALRQQKVGSRLFAVGDDWQSIYRFTGSDISLMTGFAEHFGYTARAILDETFRFNNSIAQVSTGFITKNPHQISKSLITREEVDSPRVFLGAFSSMPKGVTEVLNHISKLHGRRKAHVFVLGRYWHSRPRGLKPIAEKHKKLTVEFRTVHSVKGMEADYVVVVDMAAGKYGFPCEIADDPIIDMMLTKPEEFPHAEERRLLYTAITRAKKAAYLLVSAGAPSVFLEELDTDEAGTDRLLAYDDLASRCPECRSGGLVKRTGKKWIFFGCSNYPYCEYTTNRCPRCKSGKMVPRRGKHGRFWGCSNYSEGCRFTARMSPSDEVLAPD